MSLTHLLGQLNGTVILGLLILVILGLISAFWPRSADTLQPSRGNLLTWFGLAVGIAALYFTSSTDRKSAEKTDARIQIFQSRAEKLDAELAMRGVEHDQLEKALAQSNAERARTAEQAKQLRDAFQEAASKVADTSNPNRLKIKNTVLFDFGEAKLRTDSKEKLSRLVGFLTLELSAKPSQIIYIEGNTDNRTSGRYSNKLLSEKRAVEVKDYLREAGFPETILCPNGHADLRPYGSDTDQDKQKINDMNVDEGLRTQNRRVELAIADPGQPCLSVAEQRAISLRKPNQALP